MNVLSEIVDKSDGEHGHGGEAESIKEERSPSKPSNEIGGAQRGPHSNRLKND